jgi:hypothetical protein
MKRLMAVGVLLGVAWACGLRAWMQQFAGAESTFTWATPTALILPAAVTGALLGLAEHRRRLGRPRRWFLLAPLPLAVAPLVLPGALPALIFHGLGGGDLAVVGFGLAGAYGLTGRRRWWRVVLGAPALAVAVVPFLLPPRPGMAVTTPYGLWAALLISSFFLCFTLACTIPLRPSPDGIPVADRQDHLVDSAA